jgi:hypothetical protein
MSARLRRRTFHNWQLVIKITELSTSWNNKFFDNQHFVYRRTFAKSSKNCSKNA